MHKESQRPSAKASVGPPTGKPSQPKLSFGWIYLILLITAAGGLGLFAIYSFKLEENLAKERSAELSKQQGVPRAVDVQGNQTASSETVTETLVEDDGQLLWASPTSGEPIPLDYLPAGTQLLLHMRPNTLLAHSEADKILSALGPWGKQTLEALTRITGAKLQEITSLTLALFPDLDGKVQIGLRLELEEPWTEAKLAERIEDGQQVQRKGKPLVEGSNWACFLPTEEKGRLLVACPLEVADEFLDQDGSEALFPRDMEMILQRTDSQRMVTLVFPNKFLQMSGRKFLGEMMEPLLLTTFDLLRDEAATVAMSAHWGESFFLELQSTVQLRTRPFRFAKSLTDEIGQSHDVLEVELEGRKIHEHGREIIARLPRMLVLLGKYTRSAEVDDIAVLRTYLPLPAGHNLLMATELFVQDFTSSGESEQIADSSSPRDVSTLLQKVTSLAFPKETLQRALEMLSEDIGVPIQIAGRDLQLEGITKNQSFSLELRNRPAQEILLEVLLQANPDRTANGPMDPKQKLVYVVREPKNEKPVIIVTTRAAALIREEQLPKVFGPLPE